MLFLRCNILKIRKTEVENNSENADCDTENYFTTVFIILKYPCNSFELSKAIIILGYYIIDLPLLISSPPEKPKLICFFIIPSKNIKHSLFFCFLKHI